jgi:hypothetical protein
VQRRDAHPIASGQVAGEAPGLARVIGAPDETADDLIAAAGDPAMTGVGEPDIAEVR